MQDQLQIVAPPIGKLRQRIQEIKRINLATADIDLLRTRINFLMKGYMFQVPVWPIGQTVFRGRKFTERPTNKNELTYPNAMHVKTLQRANRIGRSMFYCSLTREPLFFELRAEPVEYIAISKWKLKSKMIAPNVGFDDETFKALGAARYAPSLNATINSKNVLAQNLVSKFFSSQFTMNVSTGEEYKYKISIAIAEECYLKKMINEDQRGEIQFGGIHYPSIAMCANSDNLALLPNFVDKYLELSSIDWVRIDARQPDRSYEVTYLDFANSFAIDGSIEWKSRRSHWKLGSGEMVKVAVENGQIIVRDMEGKLKELE